MSKFEELEKLQKLKEQGVLTEEEFNLEKTKILAGEDTNNNDTNKNMLEIKGDFPFEQSKFPIELLNNNEKIIVQHKGVMCSGTVSDGYITLTNYRIMFNKSTGKNMLRGGLLAVAIAAKGKDESIEFDKIVSIKAAKYIQGSAGIEITTKDGYTHKYVLQSLNAFNKEPQNKRDMIVELVQGVINSK